MAKRLILVGIDGCHQETLYGLIDRHEVPFFNALCENGARVRAACTMFPSTTTCCCSTLYTGCWYKHHGILNNEWMDRFTTPVQGKSYIAGLKYALDSMDLKLFGLPSILLPHLNKGGAINNDLKAPTIYDAFTAAGKTSFTFFHYIGHGATRWVRPTRTDMIRFALAEQYKKPYQIYERMLVTRAIQHIRRGMPDLLSIYFGCNDGHSHRFGVAGQTAYIRDFIDPELRRLQAALEKICPNDEIYWAVTADHGQSTMTPDDLGRCVWFDHFFPILREAGFENLGRTLSDQNLEPLDAVVSLGTGASLGFYLRNRKTRDWRALPDFESDVVRVLNGLLKANDRIGPFAEWQFPKYLDFLLTRRTFDEPYSVYANTAPYDGVGKLVPLEEFFAKKGPEYIHPIERIRGIDSPKGPDIVLVLTYQDHFNVNEVAGFHPGQHGSFLPDDSLVPMIFSGPGIRRGEIESALTVNFSPTAASMVGVSMPSADGKPLPVL